MNESGSYYDREPATYLDGSKIFQTKEDQDNEREVAVILARAWDCEIRKFADLAPVDWYAVRTGRVIGLIELKSRNNESTQYPTVFLSLRKWMCLNQHGYGLKCPGFFVVRFLDGVFAVRVAEIDATNNRLAGGNRAVKSPSDIEPQIDVPLSLFRKVSDA